mgnify:CR=1 FL=1
MITDLTPIERRLVKRAKAARRAAMGPAIIERPLRLIGGLTRTSAYQVALEYAKLGQGMRVTAEARRLLREYA